jgi:hypothetical protein
VLHEDRDAVRLGVYRAKEVLVGHLSEGIAPGELLCRRNVSRVSSRTTAPNESFLVTWVGLALVVWPFHDCANKLVSKVPSFRGE